MTGLVIIQRVVPHYRDAVFARLHQEFGWVVACARRPPGQFLKQAEATPYIREFDFHFPAPQKFPNLALVPVSRILRETGAAALIAEGSVGLSSTWSLALRRRLLGHPPFVLWSHGYRRAIAPSWRERMAQAPLRLVQQMADAHLCYSEEGRRRLAQRVKKVPIFVAPNTQDLRSMIRLAAALGDLRTPPGPHLITIARLTEDRRVVDLVSAFKQFRERSPHATLTIIGDGPDMARVAEEAGSLREGPIRLLGAVYDETVIARQMLASDLAVFPGAVGLSVNHCLGYGIPVVAYDRALRPSGPEIAYVVEDVTGFRVEDSSSDALLKKLLDIFERYPDPRSTLQDRIRRFVDERISLDAMVEGFRGLREYLRTQFPDIAHNI